MDERICSNSEELIELKQRIAAATLNQTRQNQLAEKNLIKQQLLVNDRALDAKMEEDRQRAECLAYEEIQRQMLDHMKARKILTSQLQDRQLQRQRAYEEFLKEKKQVDEIVHGIEEEDRAKNESIEKRRAELQQNITDYLEERQTWREQEKIRVETELKKIHEYNNLQEARQAELMAKKKKALDGQDAVLARLTFEIEAKRRQEDEMRNLLDELYQEEAECRALAMMKAQEEKKNQQKSDMIQQNNKLLSFKQEQKSLLQKQEQEFREKLMKKFEEDCRLDQMNAERRKREVANYKKEVEKLVEERRALYDKSKEDEISEKQRVAKEEAYRKQVIERERMRLLQQFKDNLKAFAPKGVFKDEKEYELVHNRKPDTSTAGKHGKKYDTFSL
jgi:hypothetical protein